MNPRFLAYARSRGVSPEAACDRDEDGVANMTGFMLWVRARWADWRAARGLPSMKASSLWGEPILGPGDHAEFDDWLAKEVP